MITVKFKGRLGNNMFQYALCRLIALKNNYNYFIPEDNTRCSDFFKYFDVDKGIADGHIKSFYKEDVIQTFNKNIFTVQNFTELEGFFQSEKYFSGHEDFVKSLYKPLNNEIVDAIKEKYDINEYCYIHFRGTDYKNIHQWFLPISYYQKAMEIVKEKTNISNFLIITDDPQHAKTIFPDCDIISNDTMVDFSLLYHSKCCIIPNSSFSWWAAWLSDKDLIIAPNKWFNYNSTSTQFDPIDMQTEKFLYV